MCVYEINIVVGALNKKRQAGMRVRTNMKDKGMRNDHKCPREAISLVCPRPCIVEVLNPSSFMTATMKSLFFA